MALAQNFENNCKFVFGTCDFGEAFAVKKIDMDNWKAFGKKLMHRPLGGVLRKRENDDMFKEHVVALEAARVARNYLAHQAAEPALYVAPMGGKHKLRALISKTVDRRKIEKERQEKAAFEKAAEEIRAAVRSDPALVELSKQLAIDKPQPQLSYDVPSVKVVLEITREIVERPFTKLAVAVVGPPKGKTQPAEVDVRLVCPPEVLRALRPEQVVPRVEVRSKDPTGSATLPVEVSVDKCEAHITPSMVVVRW